MNNDYEQRPVMYFKPVLKARCINLFDSSLLPRGLPCLGTQEKLPHAYLSGGYENFDVHRSIYRKLYV